MNHTSLALGTNWAPGEWPEYVLVSHGGDAPRRYVPERTCSMPPYDSGDNIMPDSGGGVIYHCSSCYHDLAIFGMNEDGDVWSAAPKYCPECGAKVEL